MLRTYFLNAAKTYDFNIHAWNCHSIHAPLHLYCTYLFSYLGELNAYIKGNTPTYSVHHYCSLFSVHLWVQRNLALHDIAWVLQVWLKRKLHDIFYRHYVLTKRVFWTPWVWIGQGLPFQEIGSGTGRSDDISRFSWSLTLLSSCRKQLISSYILDYSTLVMYEGVSSLWLEHTSCKETHHVSRLQP